MNTPPTESAKLIPGILHDTPSLIESVFPAQKVSYEAQVERKAVAAQTLTGLGSYWKGRKPLILARSVVIGTLLPPTNDPQKDLDVFERLLGVHEDSLALRALAANSFAASDLLKLVPIHNPDRYFSGRGWRRDVVEEDKLKLYRLALGTFAGYELKASVCKRPEEVDQEWLYASVWPVVNQHYSYLGIEVHSISELVTQFGILRYGHRPRVGDAFCGGGSIPFEAARVGCDAFASDLNPVACMLTWGAFNIIGAPPTRRAEIERDQESVFAAIDREVTRLGIEHDADGNRAKAFLYCVETRCPETGWMIPLSPSWLISPKQRTVAKLIPDKANRRFDIVVESGVPDVDLIRAEQGTVRGADMVYVLDGKEYRTPIKTLRGDYRDDEGNTANRLRPWQRNEFVPRSGDTFQERLYAIQWIKRETLTSSRQETFFATVCDADIAREQFVIRLVEENLDKWCSDGLVPDMAIESGEKTDEPIRTRGWTCWHHLFNPRQLLLQAIALKEWRKSASAPLGWLNVAKAADFNSRLSRWKPSQGGGLGGPVGVFSNQALNTLYNYAARSWAGFGVSSFKMASAAVPPGQFSIVCAPADRPSQSCDMWITDPPYADAVNYHEITEFFIAWLRKNPPKPFDEWVWDSRRALAIKGKGEDFRRGMVAAYAAMAKHMPDNGRQCVMFTHQDTNVWSDMVGIFWAAGLQVIAAWYIATENNTELKKGGYVQGTVVLMLKKRSAGERAGFKQHILPAVRGEVQCQIETMMHLNSDVKSQFGEPVFNDSDLQMAGYAAALRVLTTYTSIGGEDVTSFALRPKRSGEITVVDEIVQQAAEAANNLLVPAGLPNATWAKMSGIERFVFRMMDIEMTGAAKLDNYQNFAKAFRVEDYTRVMGSMVANQARLKRIPEYGARDLLDSTELGATRLGRLIIAIQQVLAETEPQTIVSQLQIEMPEFLDVRAHLVDMLAFLGSRYFDPVVCDAVGVLEARLKNLRFGA